MRGSGQFPPSPLRTGLILLKPSPATQHALTTTGAYAETTFPFRISAGAMTFVSPLPKVDTDKIEGRLSLTRHGRAQHTCLATSQADPTIAPARPPQDVDAHARPRRTYAPGVAKNCGIRGLKSRRKMRERCVDCLEEMIGW